MFIPVRFRHKASLEVLTMAAVFALAVLLLEFVFSIVFKPQIRSRDKHINSLKKKCQKECDVSRERQQRVETLERYLADLPTLEDYKAQSKQVGAVRTSRGGGGWGCRSEVMEQLVTLTIPASSSL